uniref:Uncharacterized protein n=1 Tax=Panagrolaimus superbus TaxID=310955 RepID=A0A914Z834_9BILA
MHPNITKITRVSAKNTTTTEETNVAAENKNIVTIQSKSKTKTRTIDGEDTTTTAATQKSTAPTQASGENAEL